MPPFYYNVTMTQDNTIEVTQDNQTENYAVYESADEDTIVGMYVENSIAESLGEFAAVTILDAADASEDATAEKKKDTSNYGVYELPPAVTGMYVSHDALDSEEAEDGFEAPESIGLALEPSDEESFEASLPDLDDQSDALVSGESDDSDEEDEESEPTAEEQAEALVAGSQDDAEAVESEDADAETNDESDSEDVEIADDEIGL